MRFVEEPSSVSQRNILMNELYDEVGRDGQLTFDRFLLIDTWLMSCRVLGRKVENMVLREILNHARAAGMQKLTGAYLPMERNKLVIDHYARLGFTKVREEDSELTLWELLVDGAEQESVSMKVISHGFAAPSGRSLV